MAGQDRKHHMAERIYNRSETGALDPLVEEQFSTEDELQALIAEHPELLDGEQILPGDPRRWLLITREKGIAQSVDTGRRWSVDHLIVDQDAVPTLVEVKRGSNSEIRRQVVGQMLEYAAHAAQTWTADELRRTFEDSVAADELNPEGVIRGFLETDDETDVDRFWEEVATNLTATRMRLLFVADEIPDELERIVMFLNAQMPNVEVLAVEIKQFRGKSTQTLVPRVIGRVANVTASRSSGTRQNLTRETFLSEFAEDGSRSAAERLLDVAETSGAILRRGTTSITIRIRCALQRSRITVAWLCLPSVESGWGGSRGFTFGTALFGDDAPTDNELRDVLERWVDQFKNDEFAKPVSRPRGWHIKGWYVEHKDAAEHVDVLVNRLETVISELRSL